MPLPPNGPIVLPPVKDAIAIIRKALDEGRIQAQNVEGYDPLDNICCYEDERGYMCGVGVCLPPDARQFLRENERKNVRHPMNIDPITTLIKEGVVLEPKSELERRFWEDVQSIHDCWVQELGDQALEDRLVGRYTPDEAGLYRYLDDAAKAFV